MGFQFLSCSRVTEEDPIVCSIIRKYESVLSPPKGLLYDQIAKMPVVDEAQRILSWIHEGSLLKITYQVEDRVKPETLILSIQETNCPRTKEHGKMKCVRSELSGEDRILTVTYQCPHPTCRLERVWTRHLPKLWQEAKDVLKNVKLFTINLSST